MRTQKEIQEDIRKLNQELKIVVAHESKTKAAVHILENLGWTHTNLGGWKRPVPKAPKIAIKEFDEYSRGVLRSGDFVRVGTAGPFYVISAVNGAHVSGQEILAAYDSGLIAAPTMATLTGRNLLQVSREDLKLAFKNHPFVR